MFRKFAYFVIFAALVWAGFGARVFNAQHRAIHADESEQATTFAKLLDRGEYAYNPNGPHGPTLYYYALACDKLTKLFSFDSAEKSLEEKSKPSDSIKIETLRFWILSLAIFAFAAFFYARKNLGLLAVLAGFACFAVSNICSIYSVYFVQEFIFAIAIFLTAQFAWRLANNATISNALLLGLFAGLAQSTKETSPLGFAAIFFAIATIALFDKSARKTFAKNFPTKKIFAVIGASLGAFFAVTLLFYSSFCKHWQGVADAFLSYLHFADKAQAAEHTQGAGYYFQLLCIQKSEGIYFGEFPILILFFLAFALAGATIFGDKKTLKKDFENAHAQYALFLALTAIFNIAMLSCIPYKNPWLLLSPMFFICATAGYGAARIIDFKNFTARIAGFVLLLALAYWQVELNSKALKRFNTDPRNPFLYSHTVSDFKNLISRIETCAKVSEFGRDIPVAFVTTNSPWPAPWLLRGYPNVGFWGVQIPQNIKIYQIIICDAKTEKSVESAINQDEYVSEYFGLRKNLPLKVYVKKKVFEDSIK